MSYELMLVEGVLCFLILLLFIYFKKQSFKKLKYSIYKALLIIALIYSIMEIVIVIVLKQFEYSLIFEILWKLHFCMGLIYLLFYYYYMRCVFNEKEENNFKNFILSSTANKFITIIFVIILLGYSFMPMDEIDVYNLNFIPNYTIYFYIASLFIAITTTFERVYKSKKEFKGNKKRIYIECAIIPIPIVILQLIFENISFLPAATILQLNLLYIFIENPDIELLEEISSSQKDIEQSNQTKTDFLSNMTSEIKVPMNLIVSLCDELNSMPIFNEKLVREDITQIYTSSNSLLDIVNNILDISKIETGKSIVQENNYNILNLITDVINIAKSKIGAKQVKLYINVDQNISSTLSGDYSKIYQIITNIVTNAAKYTEVGKITITLTSTKASGMETLLFKVADTGTGIKEEDQKLLFQKGARLSNATQGEIEGSGLGLAITKEYVELLGGKIWFDSQYRVGSTFYVEIPQKIVDSKPIGLAKETKKTNEKLDCSKYTVLIVDDNQLNIKVAKRLLERYNFKVESVTSGKDCIYKVKEGIEYDAIFMDHMMPEMDGIETFHVLKKLNGYKLPPIIALTANAVAGMREMYLNEGFDEYISKPINTDELDRVINLFFNK